MNTLVKVTSLLSLVLAGITAKAQVDNYAKNSKLFDDEQERFRKELRTNKDSAEVYWKHATITAGFTFNAQRNAWRYYEKALSIDSSKAQYFIDYGRYLSSMGYARGAKILYERALRIFPSNPDLQIGLKNADVVLAKNEENKRLSSFGQAPVVGRAKAVDYAKVTAFKDLSAQAADKKSPYFYENLLVRFNAGEVLTDEQMYRLLIGFTNQSAYNPYTQEANLVYELNEQEKFDEAIGKAQELLKTSPLLPALYRGLIFACRKKGKEDLATAYQEKLQSILNAMLYTGDGTCDRPYVAIWVPEEYTLLMYLDVRKTGAVTASTCAGQTADKIEVTHLTTGSKSNVYFNTSLVFQKVFGKH